MRFADAGEALEAIVDLETAPVSLSALPDSALPPEPDSPTKEEVAPSRRSSERAALQAAADSSGAWRPRASNAPSSRDVEPPPTRASSGPTVVALGARRLSRLARDPVVALVESMHALDLAMIDALARRERGSTVARIARAVALALRLELDAAALILEPLLATSDVARAFAATLVAPRARRATRARIDTDKADVWIGDASTRSSRRCSPRSARR